MAEDDAAPAAGGGPDRQSGPAAAGETGEKGPAASSAEAPGAHPASGSPASIDELTAALEGVGYLAGRDLATAVWLALKLERPLLLEGEAGVGKTELGRSLAAALGRRLIRLQCYEGLDVHSALYEWDYARQLLHIRLAEAAHRVGQGEAGQAGGAGEAGEAGEALERELFSPRYLLRRPLLEAIAPAAPEPGAPPPVLLIDELDRADEEFEAFLLELLSDFQVTVPEIGTLAATRRPAVVLTSNRTRELHDALRRRCLYQWLDYPTADQEYRIVLARVPGAPEALARQVVAFVGALRGEDLYKPPGVAETLDWTAALLALDRQALDPATVEATLGALLKTRDDLEQARGGAVERALATAGS